MSRRNFYGAAVLALLILVGSAFVSKRKSFHTKCDTLALTTSVRANIQFTVPREDLYAFNARLIKYLKASGFTFETSQSGDYLSPPDKNGRQIKLLNIKTIGCTYRTMIWSENVAREDQITVTVYRTLFGSETVADRVTRELQHLLINWDGVVLDK